MYPHIPYLAAIFLSFLGFILAGMIFHKKRKGEVLVCPIGKNTCDSVIHSDYSKIFGIEVAIVGMVYYGLSAFFYAAAISFPWLVTPGVHFIAFLVMLFAIIFTGYLVVVQAAVLRQWCTWCLGSALISTLLFTIAAYTISADIVPILQQYKTVVVVLHAFSAAVGVGAVTLTDIFFFKFLKDYRISHQEKEIMDTISDVIWAALIALIVTGIGLYLSQMSVLAVSTKFWAKVVVVGVVTVNGVLLNLIISPKLMSISFGQTHVDHPGQLHGLRRLGFALGGVSIVSWYTTFFLGSVRSLPFTTPQILLGYFSILVLVIIGSQAMDRIFVKSMARPVEAPKDPA